MIVLVSLIVLYSTKFSRHTIFVDWQFLMFHGNNYCS